MDQPARVLVIPGLEGSPLIVQTTASRLFAGMRPLLFDHHLDTMDGGVEGLAERAVALLDADDEGSAPAFVCGESFGGTVALTLARRYPTRVKGLIFLSAFARYPAFMSRCGQGGLLLWNLLGDTLAEQIVRAWRPFGIPGALGWRGPRDVLRAYLQQPMPHLHGYRAKCELALTFDARPWLHEITCPALVLTGTRDPVVPTSAGRELARLLPNARLCQLPGQHLAYFVRAAEAGSVIGSWVAELGRD